MRLSKIKIAGFKSFVDATTIAFSGNLTGIIGPNGCGKSNTIDAVRWVMGESSAKHLRGASMEDVIFKGSSARAPVGKAYVELVFDNSDASLGGQYAQYAEISTRREVTRDGKSNYYLNGSKCRRRDITDIFLGTGLGPRSYAIIEQGMISRLIEAKPEEIRIYIEEAAGISKYKERRRDTELRMRNTRENLARLDDVRDEIGKQLARLERQAKTAAKYREYKQQERQERAQLLALKWRDLQHLLQERAQQAQNLATEVQAQLASVRHFEAQEEQARQRHHALSAALTLSKDKWYQAGNRISTIEQNIRHFKDSRERQASEQAELAELWQQAKTAIEEDQKSLEEKSAERTLSQAAYKALAGEQQQAQQALQNAQSAWQNWQQSWEQKSQEHAQLSQNVARASQERDHCERQIEDLNTRLEKLNLECQQNQNSELALEVARCEQQLQELEAVQNQHQTQGEAARQQVQSARQKLSQIAQERAQKQKQLHQQEGELRSQQALQRAALGRDEQNTAAFLKAHQLDNAKRVGELLQVAKGWERALETVLAHRLEALCVADLDALVDKLNDFKTGTLTLMRQASAPSQNAAGSATTLLSLITTEVALEDVLAGVLVCEDIGSALQMRANLQAGQSVVCKDGTWLGRTWLQISRAEGKGVINREREIASLQDAIALLNAQIEEQNAQEDALAQQVQQSESAQQQAQTMLQTLGREHSDARAKLSALNARANEQSRRQAYLSQEQSQLNAQLDQARADLEAHQESLAVAKLQEQRLAREREACQQQRSELEGALNDARTAAYSQEQAAQTLKNQIDHLQATENLALQNIKRMQAQLDQLQSRRAALEGTDWNDDSTLENLQQELELALGERVELDAAINSQSRDCDNLDDQLRQYAVGKSQAQAAYDEKNAALVQHKLNAEEHRVRAQTYQEQLAQTGFAARDLLAELDEDCDIGKLEQDLEALVEKISRLGAINLAAIDEFASESERKQHLDAQHQDLSAALQTLESAIAKIDHETKSRFADTFEQVNRRIGEMFPKLFGGGQAHLQLTDDDLLNTGVTIMARPPGKRISNIHLLSGGEKALTAVAMVFAIFELNPAPFCMLDEVDAPLDEANVGRFCNLVKEMSARVQFIFITHNKPAMEMAQQLHGVTMREAGVSRIVAVNVDEAVKMVD